ncbi:MAG: accessory factor UbiK family protein [Candidatus Competibacterales bacterium]|nr:accessory factor UbiK family protein [Candidatus Competibacterales bacterium]
MIDPKQIDEMARKLAESVPPGVRQLQADVEKNLRTSLQSVFARMDLVTREEFDVQRAVLERTRARLELLERQVVELEQRVASGPTSSAPDTNG